MMARLKKVKKVLCYVIESELCCRSLFAKPPKYHMTHDDCEDYSIVTGRDCEDLIKRYGVRK